MTRKLFLATSLVFASAAVAIAQDPWPAWPPRDYLLKSLADSVPGTLKQFHADTGRFGTEPWVCNDQNILFPLAAAWAIEDANNPWHHNDELLQAIAKGGEALVDDMDSDGKWTFRKKDNSTWGQIHMPWTYSRWIRAYSLVRDALPEASRQKWERGLLLGFSGIRKQMDGRVHNIPTHHAMGLYIAGVCFDNEDWRNAATAYMAKVAGEQNPVGYWSEHFGPVVGYNAVYVDAMGIYYHFSHDPVVLEALTRSAKFHSNVLLPDGSSIPCIDERQIYGKGVDSGNVGFSWTPEGRGYLLKQLWAYSEGGTKAVAADYAAAMLLYGGTGDAVPLAAAQDDSAAILGNNEALVRRKKPWAFAFSGYACAPCDSRWIQDRQNLVDVYHDALGLVIGGGNTKLQPYWSTFTVGDSSFLRITGEEDPDFTPEIDLQWTPDAATIVNDAEKSELQLTYGAETCNVVARVIDDGSLTLTCSAAKGKRIEAHIPFLARGQKITLGSGEEKPLGEDDLVLTAEQTAGHVVLDGLRFTTPPGSTLRWPARQHNPYAKDGRSHLSDAKLVLVLPFVDVEEFTVKFGK